MWDGIPEQFFLMDLLGVYLIDRDWPSGRLVGGLALSGSSGYGAQGNVFLTANWLVEDIAKQLPDAIPNQQALAVREAKRGSHVNGASICILQLKNILWCL